MLLVKVSLLRPPSSASARSRAQLYATGDPLSPRHGLESPCHVPRAFQPVGLGRAVRSVLRPPSVFRRQPSHPILASFAPLGGQPSAVRPQSSAVSRQPSAVPSDSCAFCASLRPTLRCPSSVLRRLSSAFGHRIDQFSVIVCELFGASDAFGMCLGPPTVLPLESRLPASSVPH